MSIEAWKSLFDVATVALLFFTFAAGTGMLITGSIINSRQEGKIQELSMHEYGVRSLRLRCEGKITSE